MHPVDDLDGLLIGCGCRRTCCCGKRAASPGPSGAGNLFAAAARTRRPPEPEEDTPFIPSVASFDTPQRPGWLGYPHVPRLSAPGEFGEQDGRTGSGGEMRLDDGTSVPVGERPLIDHVAREVLPGPVSVLSGEDGVFRRDDPQAELVSRQAFLFTPLPNGAAMWGVTALQPVPASPGDAAAPLNNLDGMSPDYVYDAPLAEYVAPSGLRPGAFHAATPGISLMSQTFMAYGTEQPPGRRFDGSVGRGVLAGGGVGDLIGAQVQLTFRVGRTVITHVDEQERPTRTEYRTASFTGGTYVLTGRATPRSENPGGADDYAVHLHALFVRLPGDVRSVLADVTDTELRGVYPWLRVMSFRLSKPDGGAWTGAPDLTEPGASGVFPPGGAVVDRVERIVDGLGNVNYVAVTRPASSLLVKAFQPAEKYDVDGPRVLFRAPGVEVWGDPDDPEAGFAVGNPHRLGRSGELRVNGRVYPGGSWCGLLAPGGQTWVLHLSRDGGTVTREIVGSNAPPTTTTAAELLARSLRQSGTLTELGGDALYHTWPFDRAWARTLGGAHETVLLTVWDAWRDATREEWREAGLARPRRPWAENGAPAALPVAPPLGVTLADVADPGGWEPTVRGGVPYLLPESVEVWNEKKRAWEVSARAQTALARPLAWLGVPGGLDDRTSAGGRLRVTFPAPAVYVEGALMLVTRTRHPLKPLRVNGVDLTPLPLGREALTRREDGTVIATRGWHPALYPLPDPAARGPLTLVLTTTHPLSRLALVPVGSRGGGGDA